jgi:hypothetical protein
MANKFNGFLTSNPNSDANLADYKHASKLYVADTFRLAPKTKFLYYTVFNINPTILNNGSSFKDRHLPELNYLVKSMDLPKFTMETTPLNQYNRKTTTYTKIAYEPINLVFHDDNQGVTNGLWALYYGYYFRDRLNSPQPFTDTYPVAYQNTTYVNKEKFPFRYGLDNDSSDPFFYSIQLFTLTKKRFFSYMLCNPKITSWQHDNMTQGENGGQVENKLSVVYDAVIYNTGNVKVDFPTGFATLHYDNTQSPIGNDLIVQNGIEGIFGNVFSDQVYAGPSTYLNRIRNTLQQYVNLGNQQVPGSQTPSLFTLRNSNPTIVGGLGNTQIPSSNLKPGAQNSNTDFSSEGVANPTNLSGTGTREDLPSMQSNRTEAIQQDWGELDRYGGQLPPQLSPNDGDLDINGVPQPITTDAWADAWPQTQPQADENRVAQGTTPTADQNGNTGPVSQPTAAQVTQTLSGNFNLQQFRQRDPEGAMAYEARVDERTRELTPQYIRPLTSQSFAIINANINAARSQARARAEVEALTEFASRINMSGAGDIRTTSAANAIPLPAVVPPSYTNRAPLQDNF